MDIRDYADRLLEEFDMCCKARPMNNTVDVQIAKDNAAKWAYYLNTQRSSLSEHSLLRSKLQLHLLREMSVKSFDPQLSVQEFKGTCVVQVVMLLDRSICLRQGMLNCL